MPTLTLAALTAAVASHAAAFRCVTEYQPAGGRGDKVFPPTYEGGKYAVETRVLPRVNSQTGKEESVRVECVLLDSVQSQANRMELALLDAHRDGRVNLPLLVAKFNQEVLLKKFEVTSLEAPHRIADAIFRDSLLDGVMFRKSDKGKLLDTTDVRNATGMFGLCPMALLFGLWDSTGPRGGLGAKFQRAIVSEIIGIDATLGTETSSRLDPAQIVRGAGPLYSRSQILNDAPDWQLISTNGAKKLGKDGKPSEANHGNVTPGLKDGGFTLARAKQTTVISLSALRRLRFPLTGAATSDSAVELAARTVLTALGLAAATLTREEGADLRSRCHLVAQAMPEWELLDVPGSTEQQQFTLSGDSALALLGEAIKAAQDLGLPWEGEIMLIPHDDLVELVRRSQVLASATGDV